MIANLPKDVRVGIINVAVGGCKIELFDKDNYQAYVSTAPSWMLGMIKEYGEVKNSALRKFDFSVYSMKHQEMVTTSDNLFSQNLFLLTKE